MFIDYTNNVIKFQLIILMWLFTKMKTSACMIFLENGLYLLNRESNLLLKYKIFKVEQPKPRNKKLLVITIPTYAI